MHSSNRGHFIIMMVTLLSSSSMNLTSAFTSHHTSHVNTRTPHHQLYSMNNNDQHQYDNEDTEQQIQTSRRQLFSQVGTTAATTIALMGGNPSIAKADIEGVATIPTNDPNPVKNVNANEGVILYKTKSGLQYIDLREGTGPTPKYGNLVSISYKAYVKLPTIKGKESKFEEFDSDNGYLVKHGNGRMIPGLDEGLHTLAVGGKRRIIIPPKLGYIGPGVLGPLPTSPLGRYKLNKLLDQMVEVKGGNLVFDVEMKGVLVDEADQGYYEDGSLTPAEFDTLRRNLSARAQEARANGVKAVDFLGAVIDEE